MPSIDMIDKETKDESNTNSGGMMLLQWKNKRKYTKKPHRHDADANEEHRKTEPHPAASYVPGKCQRTPDPADEGQEKYGAAACKWSGAYKPKTQTNNPDYGCLLDWKRPAPAQEDTATESRACNNR